MSPVSESQKKLACIALSMVEGKTERSYSKQAAEMMKSMKREDLEKFCHGEVKKE